MGTDLIYTKKHLLSALNMLNTVLGIKDTIMNRIEKVPALIEIAF